MEVVELMKRRQLLVIGVQETKWKGDRAVYLSEGFKMLYAGVVALDMNAHVGKRQNSEETVGKYG